MKSPKYAALALLATCSAVKAIDVTSSVTDLNSGNFDKFISSHDIVMAEFFASWCGVCDDVAPIYEQAAAESPTKNVTYARVDCAENQDLCDKYFIGMVPTFYVFDQNPEKYKAFNNKREVGEFHSFLERHAGPSTRTISSKDQIDSFKTEENVAIVAFADQTNGGKMLEEYLQVADEMRHDFLFGLASDVNVAEAAGVKQPSIVLYKNFDERVAIYTGASGGESISKFIKNASIPLIDDYSKASLRIQQEGLPIAFVYYEKSQDRESVVEMLRPTAEEHRGKIIVVTMNPAIATKHAEKFDIKKETWPGLAITDKTGHKFPLRQPKLTTQLAAQHVRDYLDGKLEPHFRSQAMPSDEEASGPVQHVVRDNFEDLVLNNDRDVLLEFYAPWCGFCKKLEPEYDELARLYNDFSGQVTVAKLDATANDIDGHDISSFPTIKLFPARGKKALEFEGDRSLEGLADFIKFNGTHGVGVALPLPSQVVDEPKSSATVVTEEISQDRDEL